MFLLTQVPNICTPTNSVITTCTIMAWSRVRWVLNNKSDGSENRDHTLKWIQTLSKEMIFSIEAFTFFPQGYDAVDADKSYTMMTDFSRRIFKKHYWITVEGASILLESGLGLSMSHAYYCSRKNLVLRIGANPVRTRDAYECVAAFWSHWREVFTLMHEQDNTHPHIEQVLSNISMDGQEDQDLLNVQMWISNSGAHDWKMDLDSDDNHDSDSDDVNN